MIVSADPAQLDAVIACAAAAGVPAATIGETGGGHLRMSVDGVIAVDCALAEAERRWATGLDRFFAGRAA